MLLIALTKQKRVWLEPLLLVHFFFFKASVNLLLPSNNNCCTAVLLICKFSSLIKFIKFFSFNFLFISNLINRLNFNCFLSRFSCVVLCFRFVRQEHFEYDKAARVIGTRNIIEPKVYKVFFIIRNATMEGRLNEALAGGRRAFVEKPLLTSALP